MFARIRISGRKESSEEIEASSANKSADKIKRTPDNEIHINLEHSYCILNFFPVFFSDKSTCYLSQMGKKTLVSLERVLLS